MTLPLQEPCWFSFNKAHSTCLIIFNEFHYYDNKCCLMALIRDLESGLQKLLVLKLQAPIVCVCRQFAFFYMPQYVLLKNRDINCCLPYKEHEVIQSKTFNERKVLFLIQKLPCLPIFTNMFRIVCPDDI